MATWDLQNTSHHILICNGGSCMNKGGEEVTQSIRETISAHDMDVQVHTTRTRCNGRCEDACVVILYPEGTWFKGVTPELGEQIVSEYIKEGLDIEEKVYSYDKTFILHEGSSLGKRK
ncbi:(2Fe-2S) ferredoxin domain-containing protein [Bacillus alkalicellulosilyticus]|uniref:(2Fe-2S) ferredoxin domain-containing protein n=1 Tax=Alkalihalobacterium alkalicellulosilyticum TaxID=1912214 RepID=UPI0009969E47|nr:(2Fe-2S) ferredoxin domain-containing protein [Bacillus alkalicellulosilyticus]